MGAVTADVVLLGDFLVQRVGAGSLRQLEEEGGIEHEDLRNIRQQGAHDLSALGLRTVVQRGEHGEVLDLADGLVVDQSRLREDGTTLHHAMADGTMPASASFGPNSSKKPSTRFRPCSWS